MEYTEYTILKIEEDIDFGCEERTEGSPVMAVLTLRDANGSEQVRRYPDRELYRLNINEGERIRLDPASGLIQKGAEEQS